MPAPLHPRLGSYGSGQEIRSGRTARRHARDGRPDLNADRQLRVLLATPFRARTFPVDLEASVWWRDPSADRFQMLSAHDRLDDSPSTKGTDFGAFGQRSGDAAAGAASISITVTDHQNTPATDLLAIADRLGPADIDSLVTDVDREIDALEQKKRFLLSVRNYVAHRRPHAEDGSVVEAERAAAEDRSRAQSDGRNLSIRTQPNGQTPTKALSMEVLASDPDQVWSVTDVLSQLQARGHVLSADSVRQALQRLVTDGDADRPRRGHYRLAAINDAADHPERHLFREQAAET